MNVAVVISVPQYDALPNLPACESDMSLIEGIIQHTGRFEQIEILDGTSSSSDTKAQLAKFVERMQGQSIDELFFYFTGHGDFYDGEFYFVLHDYVKARRQQTALSNSELDTMLRSLNPGITAKVIDACYAGVPYIKDTSALENYLRESRGGFKKCYFMFSSQASQSSFQDQRLSTFTQAFGRALLSRGQSQVRYKDIIDHIADSFQDDPQQTPCFVVQADFIEVFCTLSQELRDFVTARLKHTRQAVPAGDEETVELPGGLVAALRGRASTYCSRLEAESFLASLFDQCSQFGLAGEVREVYDIEIKKYARSVPFANPSAIGRWLEQSKEQFFAEPTYRIDTETKREWVLKPRPPMALTSSVASLFGQEYEQQDVAYEVQRVDGFTSTGQLPYYGFSVKATPRLENLPSGMAMVLIVLSKRLCVLFFALETLRELDWDDTRQPPAPRWNVLPVEMKEDLEAREASQHLMQALEDFLREKMRDAAGMPSVSDDTPVGHSADSE